MKRSTIALLAVVLVAGVPAAHAQEGPGDSSGQAAKEKPSTIVIVSMTQCCAAAAWPEAEGKAHDEFKALEFPVNIMIVNGTATSEGDQRAEMESIADREDALCALRIERVSGGAGIVELWVADRLTKKTVMRSISVESKSDAEGATLAALGLVELFQAALIELNLPGAPKGNAAAPPEITHMAADMVTVEKIVEVVKEVPAPPAKAPPARAPGPFGLRLGCAASGSPGGGGALGSVLLALRWNVIPLMAFEVDGTVSFAGQGITQGDLHASFDVAQVRGWIFFDLSLHRIVRASFGVGGGMLALWSTGTPTERYAGDKVMKFTGYLGAGVHLGLVLTRVLMLKVGFAAGFAVPRVAVYFGGEKAASFGLPCLEGSVGVEVKFP